MPLNYAWRRPAFFLLPLRLTLLPALLLCAWFSTASAADADRLATLAGDGALMLRAPDGENLVRLNPDRALIPASVLKIPLAQVALATLGEDFRFETHFYRNAGGDLLIRGLGDPFLISEEIAMITDILARRGLGQVTRLVVDDSAFERNPDLPLQPGIRDPYGARNGALAVNFNTVNLARAPDGELVSAEPQTPLTPLARELGAGLFADEPRPTAGTPLRINLGENPLTGLRQVQQLFHAFLERSGITVTDTGFYHEAVNDEWTLFYRHASSHSLNENLDGLLRYSNNFIANQLFLTIGAQQHGYPATTEAAREVLQEQLAVLYGEGFGRDPETLLMLEGSGLDREQRASASAMMQVLEVFRPHAELLPETDGALAKSGTFSGVYNYAGYIRGAGGLYPFVILTNQAANRRGEILQLLQQRVVGAR